MKNAKEIIVRSVILLCISDRCALEKSIINGKIYSKKQRDQQRLDIYQWLKNKGYYEMMLKSEKMLFEQDIGSRNTDEIIFNQFQYEAIEPCLWTLGLVKNLSNYDGYVLDDFHPVLQIDMNHTLEKVLKTCCLKTNEEIHLQNKIAMLWHWRAVESNISNFNIRNYIISTFGQEYNRILDSIQQFDRYQNDFMVNDKLFGNLNSEEKMQINYIALWRHHAFEWIVSDEAWDLVEVNT